MSLWTVRASKVLVVEAKDEADACRTAKWYARQDDGPLDATAGPIPTLARLPAEWRDSIPWREPPDPSERTCRQILEADTDARPTVLLCAAPDEPCRSRNEYRECGDRETGGCCLHARPLVGSGPQGAP